MHNDTKKMKKTQAEDLNFWTCTQIIAIIRFFSQIVGRKGSRIQGFEGPRVAESHQLTAESQPSSIPAPQHTGG